MNWVKALTKKEMLIHTDKKMNIKNHCKNHGTLDLKQIIIKDNKPKCILCDSILTFKEEVKLMTEPKEVKSSTSVKTIKCSNCGKLKQAGEPRYSRLVEKYGNVGLLNANYRCRECRKSKKDD